VALRGTDAIPLAPLASPEQYQKLARGLAGACQTGEIGNVRDWAAGWIERLAHLLDVSVAQEYSGAEPSRSLAWSRINREAAEIAEQAQQDRLLESRDAAAIRDRAELFLAELHGFESWPAFARHLDALDEASSPISQFESAADAIVTGNQATVERLVAGSPGLVRARSTRNHRATLLHYVAANGHEGFRQRTPPNAVEIARLLLEAGAEPDALADMYGHRCTTMQMLVSSAHPHEAGLQVPLVDTLLGFGAAIDGVDGDGSPLMTALRFHYPKTAEALARRGARVDNVVSAAALGRADLVDRFVGNDGTLAPAALVAHGPWPRLPRDPKVHLGYALTWATAFGRDEVVELLIRKGVDPSGQDDDAPALHFAAAYGRLTLVHLMLEHGASLETRNSYGGTVLDGTLWYAFNAPISGVDYAVVVRDLIAAGARTDVYPEMNRYVEAVLGGTRGGGYPDVSNPS
jgi:ankyrin repeat protein